MTKLERVYILNLVKDLKKTEQISKNFTTNDLRKYIERHLCKETAGGITKVSRAEFMLALDISGFKLQQVLKRSPNYYINVCSISVMSVLGDVM